MGGVQEGRQGVEADYETTDEFREAWKLKARDVLAKAEFRRRKLTKRVHTSALKAHASEQRDHGSHLVMSVL